MKKNEPISKIMSSNLHTVQIGQKLSEVRALLAEKGFHHVPVLDGDQLVGIISSNDILRAGFGSSEQEVDSTLDHTTSVKKIMSDVPKTLTAKDTVRSAAEILAEGAYHSLPITEEGRVVGIVTSTDLIRYLLNQY